jgi:hypothetical protein
MTLAACSACAKRYVFEPDEATARVFVVDGWYLLMRKDGETYQVVVQSGQKYASIPATGPVVLGRHLQYGGYPVLYECSPTVALTPEPEASYVLDAVFFNDGCLAQLVREDSRTRTGVKLEPSARPMGSSFGD